MDVSDELSIRTRGRSAGRQGRHAIAVNQLRRRPARRIHAARAPPRRDRSRPRCSMPLPSTPSDRCLSPNTLRNFLIAMHVAWWPSLSARVGSIGDNRLGGWYAYRGSKAALNMFYAQSRHRTAAHLCRGDLYRAASRHRRHSLVATVSGARTRGRSYFQPSVVRANCSPSIERLESADNGRFIAWDGSAIPW